MYPFVGKNHPRFGKTVPQEVRDKISATLTGRKLSAEHVQNIVASSHKKEVYCYDANTKEFIVKFDGLRIMSREIQLSTIVLSRKIDTAKIQHAVYKGQKVTWLLRSKPIV